MTTDRLRDYFDHMIEATRLACSYVEGMGKDDFLGDKRTQQAVIDINMEIVWDTVCAALPALVTQISSIRQSLPSGNDFNREQ